MLACDPCVDMYSTDIEFTSAIGYHERVTSAEGDIPFCNNELLLHRKKSRGCVDWERKCKASQKIKELPSMI